MALSSVPPRVAGLLTIVVPIAAAPAGTTHFWKVSCSRRLQVGIPTTDTGTQCIPRRLKTTGCQTEADPRGREADTFPPEASSEGCSELPASQEGVENTADVPVEPQGEYTCSCGPRDTGKFPNNQQRTQIGANLYACQSCEQRSHLKTGVTINERVYAEKMPYMHCGFCEKDFYYADAFFSHMKVHTNNECYACRFCPESYASKHSLLLHEKGHSGEMPFGCSICWKSFTTESCLVRHERTHTGEKPYACNTCHRGFSRKCDLGKHEMVHSDEKKPHTGEKPYACNTCNKGFSLQCRLVKHEMVLSDEGSHVCSICQRVFSKKEDLSRHASSHAVKRPFLCGICQKSLTTKMGLVRHERTHTGEKPYACNTCHRCFSRKCGLGKHKLVHSSEKKLHTGEKPYACNTGNKGFSLKCRLVKHEIVLSDEGSHVCSICQRVFSKKEDLSRHSSSHAVERPFLSGIC